MAPTDAQAPFSVVEDTTRSAPGAGIPRASVWLCLGIGLSIDQALLRVQAICV
jgi:hypothetical protein